MQDLALHHRSFFSALGVRFAPNIHIFMYDELFMSDSRHTDRDEVARAAADGKRLDCFLRSGAARVVPEAIRGNRHQTRRDDPASSIPRLTTVVAHGNYVSLERESGLYRLHEPIFKSWAEQIRTDATGKCRLRLKGGKELTVTRRYKKNMKSLAELWLGQDSRRRR
jgi:hypothetical protein